MEFLLFPIRSSETNTSLFFIAKVIGLSPCIAWVIHIKYGFAYLHHLCIVRHNRDPHGYLNGNRNLWFVARSLRNQHRRTRNSLINRRWTAIKKIFLSESKLGNPIIDRGVFQAVRTLHDSFV